MYNFAAGIIIGLMIGGTIGLVMAGLFAAAKSDEQKVEVDMKVYKNKSEQ